MLVTPIPCCFTGTAMPWCRGRLTRVREWHLRVVYLDHTAALSGGELALLRLLRALATRVDAHVILGEHGPLVGELRKLGVEVEVMALPETARSATREAVSTLAGLPAAARAGSHAVRLSARLRRLAPDVVHCNSLKACVYGGVAARLAGVPVVWHLRDRLTADYLPSRVARGMRVAAAAVPTALIANSGSTACTLGRSGRRAAVIASPVDLESLLSVQPVATGRVRQVTMVGRLAAWKGQHVFLRAFARAFGGRDVRARIVGSALFGELDYETQLRRLVRQLSLEGQVDFVGFAEDIPGELSRADIFVHASTIPEPFGQVVVEAMAGARPVIAADAGGPAEIVTHDVTGLLHRPGDVDALVACLSRLAGDDELRLRLARSAREAVRRFDPENIAEQVLGVYRNLV